MSPVNATIFPADMNGHRDAASLLARCAALANSDTAIPAKERREMVTAYGDRAMEFLREAIQRGLDVKTLSMSSREFGPSLPLLVSLHRQVC